MKIGTRKSLLARKQTAIAANVIQTFFPDLKIEEITLDTQGDLNLDKQLIEFGGKGAFTQDLERAIVSGELDMAVHSAKDMPIEIPPELAIGAALARADVRDVFVSCKPIAIENLSEGAVIGTGSLRRQLQAKEINCGIQTRNIRGNVPTRLTKLAEGIYDGIILAAAGLIRLGYVNENENFGYFSMNEQTFYFQCLNEETFLPAAGQGIIALEIRKGDLEEIMKAVNDYNSYLSMITERAFLKAVGGNCNEAAAIRTQITGQELKVTAKYAADGIHLIKCSMHKLLIGDLLMDTEIAEQAGIEIADMLLKEEVIE